MAHRRRSGIRSAGGASGVLLLVLVLATVGTGASPSAVRHPPPRAPNVTTVLTTSQTLTGDLRAANLTINPGVTLRTNGYSVLVNGTFDNLGTIVTGVAPYGAFPSSYGGSGGGAASYNYRAYIQSGYATRAAGGASITSGFNDSGATPSPPASLTAGTATSWYLAGIQSYLAGAGGGNVTGYITGGAGAFGVYISATTLVAGTIQSEGQRGAGHCSGIGLAGGGGGGAILLVAGTGGIVPGDHREGGGSRAYDCGYGTTASGAGGRGQYLTVGPIARSAHDWHQLHPTTSAPGIFWGSVAYDPAEDGVVLFGGLNATSLTNATWVYTHDNWVNLNLTVAPSPRRGAAMAWDPHDREIVLFGGATPNAGNNETWVLSGGRWTEIFPAVAPPARASASMVWDPGLHALVLFGGTSNHCCSNAGLGDTWSFVNGSWSAISPTTSPPQRNEYGFTDDRNQSELVLFGGWQPSGGCGGTLNDTWGFSNGSWTPLSAGVGPSTRQGDSLAYTKHLGLDLLFGGLQGTCGSAQTYLKDTWAFSAGGWSKLALSHAPSARAFQQMVYDPAIGKILMVGGQSGLGAFNDTWVFS